MSTLSCLRCYVLLTQTTRTLLLPLSLSTTEAKITFEMQELIVTDKDHHANELTCSDFVNLTQL